MLVADHRTLPLTDLRQQYMLLSSEAVRTQGTPVAP